jgi:hypothetical protein
LGITSTPAKGCCTGPPGYIGWQPVRQPFAGVDFIPQSGIYEFGYRYMSVCMYISVRGWQKVVETTSTYLSGLITSSYCVQCAMTGRKRRKMGDMKTVREKKCAVIHIGLSEIGSDINETIGQSNNRLSRHETANV